MQPILISFMQVFRKGILLVTLVGLFNLIGWLNIFTQPSYAVSDPQEAIQEIRKDLAEQNPEKIYEEATKVAEDPKRGVEKKYEKNMSEFYEEHPEEGGIIQEAKAIVKGATKKD
jgi:hypothetical protein